MNDTRSKEKYPVVAETPVPSYGLPWEDRPSLSEALAQAESAFSVTGVGFVEGSDILPDLAKIYCNLYYVHFGRRLTASRMSDAAMSSLNKVFYKCREQDLDIPTYISAQMEAMKPMLSRVGKRFWPNMMCSPKALLRYNVYIKSQQRKYHSIDEDRRFFDTSLARFITGLELDTEHVAAYFIHEALEGHDVSWDKAIDAVSPSDSWLMLHRSGGPAFTKLRAHLRQQYGEEDLQKAKHVATLRAAVEIVSRYGVNAPDRIGFRGKFSWEALAELLKRVFGKTVGPAEIDLGDVPGFVYQPVAFGVGKKGEEGLE